MADDRATWQGHERRSAAYNRILLAVGFAGVATFAQLYSPQQILPDIAASLHVTADRSALMISAATIGLAVGVLPWSWVADRIGRLPAMRISVVAATVLGFAVLACPTLPGILVLRTLEGLMLAGLPALALTYLQEEIHPRHVALAAATYVAGTTIGGLLGRVVAGPFAAAFGWRVGIGVVVAIAAVTAALFIAITPSALGFQREGRDRPAGIARLVWANLRSPALLVLLAQAFLLMGGFVTVYNYLGFRLQAAPFDVPASVTPFLALAYLAGTVSSRQAGSLALRIGRLRVLLGSTGVLVVGVLLTLSTDVAVVVVGLVLLTAGFFGAHAIAAGWTAATAAVGRAQATSLYNLSYYAGSSVVGWAGGLVFIAAGWDATAALVIGMAVLAAVLAAGSRRLRTVSPPRSPAASGRPSGRSRPTPPPAPTAR